MKRWLPDLADSLVVLGGATVVAGLLLVHVPTAVVVAGLLVIIFAVIGGSHGRTR